jgi:hypothetical protein
MPVDLHAEGREVWKTFERMADRMPGFELFKQSPDFAQIEGVRNGANLYTYFPFLFIETFPEIGKQRLRRLSLMGLLYTLHIVIADSLIDRKDSLPPETILVSNACCLGAHEILTQLFGARPVPWRQIKRLHQQYSLANTLEKQRHYQALREYRPQDLLTILSRKSAMAKLIPLTLCALADRPEHLKPLMRSFDMYYASEQLVDDFRDWKQDLKAGRYSYLLTRVMTACNLRPYIEAASADQVIERVGKSFYLSGLAESYLNEAITYCEKARKAVEAITCPRWLKFLDIFQMGIHVSQSNISKRSRQILLQTDKYSFALAPTARVPEAPAAESRRDTIVPHPVRSVASSIAEAGCRAVEFLKSRYKPGVGFEDFMMARGQLAAWVSAYTGVALLGWIGRAGERLKSRRSLLPMLNRMAVDLIGKQRKYGWAPSEPSPEDADTTGWVVGFLLDLGWADRRVIGSGTESLLKYQQPDGGFSTYLPTAMRSGMDGFTSSHVEVTALVLEVLLRAGLKPDSEIVRKGIEYIKEKQGADGLWEAYWWDGQMYATHHCLRALQAQGQPFSDEERGRLVAAILSAQGEEGDWGEKTVGKNKPFETALALKTLMMIDGSMAGACSVKRAIAWLLNHQNAEGGFNSAPMMRLPERDEKEPWKKSEWALDSVTGFSILGRDQNCFFTTATVLSALADFLALAGDHQMMITRKLEKSASAI